MKRTVFNKKIMYWLRFIYRFGLVKSILLFTTMMASAEEYHLKWKGYSVYLRKGTTDFRVFCQVLIFEQYRTGVLKMPADPVIMDLGANIGLSALYYKQQYPGAVIIAVEPDTANYQQLLKNVQQLSGIYCINKAIWSTSKLIALVDEGRGEYGFQVKEAGPGITRMVSAVSMPELLKNFNLSNISLLKIDIEGTEKELFSKGNLSWVDRVDNIIIELHDWIFPGCSVALFRAIDHRFYQLSWKGENLTIAFSPVAGNKNDVIKQQP